MTYYLTIGAFILAMLASYGLARRLTGLSRAAARRWGVLSPVTGRSSHTTPTPRLGGIGLALGFAGGAAIFLGTLAALPALIAARESIDDADAYLIFGFNPALVGWLAFGWFAMFAVGLADDRFDFPPLAKLTGMTLAALAPILGAGVRAVVAQPVWMPTGLHVAVGIVLALGWILFFTNGYNFMDGMDGFAAGFARVAAVGMFLMLFIPATVHNAAGELRAEALLLPILAMACWGFLHWNRPPARVFMGDGGSLSVGYLLAVYPLLGADGRLGVPLGVVGSLTILLPFVFDVLLTLVRRLHRGENVLKAHREHLYQRLMKTGLSHAEVLRMNVARFLICAALALIGHIKGGALDQGLALALALIVMLQYWRLTLRRERDIVP
jgi:UDP-N-acetylmuramyl pentapeptide phosphotransferase/UDP-N-acetylglucosamine-1-phosphate transferase